jgi:hypothetical protein
MHYDGIGHLTAEQVVRYSLDRGDPTERSRIRQHLNECADCRGLVIDARDDLRLIKK